MHVYGFGDGKFPITMNIERQFKNGFPVTVEEADCIYIKDLTILIKKIIENCLIRSKGPFMFKKFSIADAMYAPVMFRFKIYNIKLSSILEKYLNNLLNIVVRQQESNLKI